ncbi:hypothetical protein ABT187_30770 [Streptomyces sp. NPDC001817]|uniref:hypothetical protein n=1 Tax=Streptomyces sp. NPDC001817 TaxID=3154398 RepID=UPI0033206DDA
MSAEPIMEPVMTQDPIDLLNAIEEASPVPIRPEYVEGTIIVPPQPNYNHSKGAYKLAVSRPRTTKPTPAPSSAPTPPSASPSTS